MLSPFCAAAAFDVWKHYDKVAPAPAETFNFTVEKVSCDNPDVKVEGMPQIEGFVITFDADTDIKSLVMDAKYKLDLPSFTRVGKYVYKISETPGTTAGVTYDSIPVYLVVDVLTDGNNHLYRYVSLHKGSDTSAKFGGSYGEENYVPAFTNTFSSTKPNPDPDPANKETGFGVKKTVSGNSADDQRYFDFKVTFTIAQDKTFDGTISVTGGSNQANPATASKTGDKTYEVDLKLKHNDTIYFGSVPVGTTYAVSETVPDGYTASVNNVTGTVDAEKVTIVTIDNNCNKEIPAGVSLDSLPYVIMLTVVAAAAVLIMLKKRAAQH